MSKSEIQYSIVVPVYNEELVIGETYKRLKKVMDSTKEAYEIIFVNDGSKDGTVEIAKTICSMDKNIKLLSFSRNFGHQLAISAGMDYSSGNAVVVIDADLQDPPEVILKMIEKWKEGYDVVYGKRAKREGETFFKKFTAKAFYRTLKSMTDIDIPVDTGDFRLIDRKVCDKLKSIPEHNRYVRGLVSWIGYKQTGVQFVRHERFAGETKYPLKKMLKFASDGIASFSYKPLKFPLYIGGVVSAISFLYFIFELLKDVFTSNSVSGLSLAIATIFFLIGIIFVVLGVMGEYISRMSDEAKGRPLYIIGEKEGFKDED
ncbi:glycosyltransferase family 2 protein [Clostridium guangxiense]|uniref:glycosyltransferase family 2 protein n=1 Tax=Clostridium guangxiense TaxID=1662055 RepID=UPI001E2DCC16|nr:glycosyltransferase family 2 protein [Clostridium guangxiense]MCD2348306.1 glycosyltransferase family 2 protein [Clostridium guangxiense]